MMNHGNTQDTQRTASTKTSTKQPTGRAHPVRHAKQANRNATGTHHTTTQKVSSMNSADDYSDRRHEVVYCSKLGFLYHRKRERFFDLCDKATKSLTVLLGASLLASYVRDAAPVVGATVSAIGLLALVFGYTDRKQRHKELAEAFAGLLAKVEIAGVACTLADVNQWLGELHQLNAKEPPTLGTLVVLCQNEIAIAEGKRESVVPVSAYKQLFANWRDFHVAT